MLFSMCGPLGRDRATLQLTFQLGGRTQEGQHCANMGLRSRDLTQHYGEGKDELRKLKCL